MKKMYLFSDVSRVEGFKSEVSEELVSDVLGTNKITFISACPNDLEESQDKVAGIINNFGKLGINFNEVELLLKSDSDEEIKIKLDGSDVIFLLGGNPLEQYNFMKDKNLVDFVKEYNGTIMGISAGSMNLSRMVLMLSVSEEYPETVIYEGLKLVPFSIFPHFNINSLKDGKIDMGYGQKFIMKDLIDSSQCVDEVYCLPDRCTLVVEGGKIKILDDECFVIKNGLIEKIK